ncbi:MAG: pyridoxal-phosphate dependent enzyme [Bacteroidota bacterium]
MLPKTRIHQASSLEQKDATVYVKREDESGFGISGCKKRKYASLLPWLSQREVQLVALIGGARSNHVISLLQLLREYRIDVQLFLKKNHAKLYQGNQLLLHLLADQQEIVWLDSSSWSEVETIAQESLEKSGTTHFMVPEGGTCAPALPGACSLMLDIIRNEAESGIQFDHIFLDSGTALMAGATCLVHHWLAHPAQLHVVLVAGSEAYFAQQLMDVCQWSEGWNGSELPAPTLPQLYRPVTAKSFGSVNASVVKEVKRLAREEGLLTDPIYTAKLFGTARHIIQADRLRGNVLIVHSGGGTGLMGFGEKLFGESV